LRVTTSSTTSTTQLSTSVFESNTQLHHKDVVSDINTIDYLNMQNDNKCKNKSKLFLYFHNQEKWNLIYYNALPCIFKIHTCHFR
jgi:hypothetical protein